MVSLGFGDRALPLTWTVEAGPANLGFEPNYDVQVHSAAQGRQVRRYLNRSNRLFLRVMRLSMLVSITSAHSVIKWGDGATTNCILIKN